MEITQFTVFSGCAMEWNEQGVCYGGKDAEKLVAHVQTGYPGKGGAGGSLSGDRSKLSAADQLESGFIRVGSINCSAFGGPRNCVNISM
jgi:hypothetical protein